MTGWIPCQADWWSATADALTASGQPWPESSIRMDLRWWADQKRFGVEMPSRRELAKRWNRPDGQGIRSIMRDSESWIDRTSSDPTLTQLRPNSDPTPTQRGTVKRQESECVDPTLTQLRPNSDPTLTTRAIIIPPSTLHPPQEQIVSPAVAEGSGVLLAGSTPAREVDDESIIEAEAVRVGVQVCADHHSAMEVGDNPQTSVSRSVGAEGCVGTEKHARNTGQTRLEPATNQDHLATLKRRVRQKHVEPGSKEAAAVEMDVQIRVVTDMWARVWTKEKGATYVWNAFAGGRLVGPDRKAATSILQAIGGTGDRSKALLERSIRAYFRDHYLVFPNVWTFDSFARNIAKFANQHEPPKISDDMVI